MDVIYYGESGSSYFNLVTGSYFTQYEQMRPMYHYHETSGSDEDYLFRISSSLKSYNEEYPLIDDLSLFGSGSSIFTMTGSKISSPKTSLFLNITSPS